MRFLNVFAGVFLLLPFIAGAEGFSRTQCRIPADQGTGSLFGAWDGLPITLVLDREFYSANGGKAAKAMKRAVHTWNEWAKLRGKVAFVISRDGEGMDIPHLSTCSQADYTSAVRNAVGVWMISNRGDRANQRDSCGKNTDGLTGKILPGVSGQTDWESLGGRISSASILLNFDDFNIPGKPRMDVESAFVHELGHVLGLLHSCNGSGPDSVDNTSAPLCTDAPEEYRNAVMAPFKAGDIRRKLNENDYNRVNCLY